MREIELSSAQCMTLIHSITVGDSRLHAVYKNRKGRKRVVLQFGDIPDSWSEEQIDQYLKGVKVILPEGFVEYPIEVKK